MAFTTIAGTTNRCYLKNMDHDPGKADRNAISALLDCFFDPGNTNSSLSKLAKCQSKESAQHNIRAKIKPRAVDADHCVEPSLNSTNAVHQPLPH